MLANVGGIYFAEKMEGDPVEAYRSVPRERQREALLFCLAQLKDMKWLDNAELIRDMPLMGSPPSRSWLRWCRSSWPPRRVWL